MFNGDDVIMRIIFNTSCGISQSVLHLLTLTIPPSPHIRSLIIIFIISDLIMLRHKNLWLTIVDDEHIN